MINTIYLNLNNKCRNSFKNNKKLDKKLKIVIQYNLH